MASSQPTYEQEIENLTREVEKAQPVDILQFCANYFNRRLEDQRADYLSSKPPAFSSSFRMSCSSDAGGGHNFPGTSGPFGGFGGGNDNNPDRFRRESEDTFQELSPSPTAPGFFRNTLSGPGSLGIGPAPITPHSPFSVRGNNPFGGFSGPFGESARPAGISSLAPAAAHVRSPSPNHELPVNYNMSRRTSVSAESLNPSASADEWAPPVYPKNPEQLARLKAAIADNFLFTSLEEDQLSQVLSALNEKPIPAAGTRIITQGDVGDFFYVVEKGQFDIYVNPSGKMEPGLSGMGKKVNSVGPGGSFGELALMYNAPRAATIVSTIPHSILWSLDRITFRRIILENTYKRRRMYEAFLEEVPILSSLNAAERAKIADALSTRTFESGSTIIRQGDPGDNFYIIESGICDVYKDKGNGDEHIGVLQKGDYFGELALLHDEPRAASIICRSKVKVASLAKDGFQRLLGPVVDILRRNDPRLKTDVGPLDKDEMDAEEGPLGPENNGI